jgi:TetR/AcrR family tetracycline transcriptional repressor
MRNSLTDVVSAALRVLNRQGLEGCSMRQVASELDVQPSALYHHVDNKQSLLALMANEIIASVHGENVHEFCMRLRSRLLEFRDGAEIVLTLAAFQTEPSQLERRLCRLVDPDAANTLMLYTLAHAMTTQVRQHAAQFGALLPSEAEGSSRQQSLAQADPEASFSRGLSVVLRGLEP